MFEKLIWTIVEYYAHKYVRGFRPEAMKIDLWNGRMVMNNVELNTSELESLNLPLHIKMGYIHQLSIEIPWSRILSDSVHIKIKGIELEVIPNHCYKPSNIKKESKSEDISGYLSVLQDRILDNLIIDIDLIKISFCDYGGSFPSTIWVCFKKLSMINKKDPIQVENNDTSTCDHCSGYKWSNTSTISSDNANVKKEIIIQGFDIYLEEYNPNIKKKKRIQSICETIQWYKQFKDKKMYCILQNLTVSISIIIDKVPYPHLHFCYILCDKPIEIHLRDTDIQAFIVIMNELKHILFKKYEGSKSNIDTTLDIDIDTTEDDSEGMFSWFGSTFSRFGSGWFTTSDKSSWDNTKEENNDELQNINNKLTNEELTNEIESFEKLPDIELTEEERKKLENIQYELKIDKEEPSNIKVQHTIQRICVKIDSIVCNFIQHVEFPDYLSHKYYVIPRPLIRIMLNNLCLRQVSRNQQTRVHFSLENIIIEDQWNKKSLFSEILQSPINSKQLTKKDKNKPKQALHIHFFKDSKHSILPSLQLRLESIQIVCPPELVKRIITFLSMSLPEPSTFKKNNKTNNDTLLLNDISNLDDFILLDDKSDSEEDQNILDNSIIQSDIQPKRQSTSISVTTNTIRVLFSDNFDKTDTEIIVLNIHSIQFQQLVQFQQQQSNNLITTFNGSILHTNIYSTSLPSYLCNSTTNCFYFTDTIDIDFGIQITNLSIPSNISSSIYCQESEIESYNCSINIDFNITPIICYITPLKIDYLLELLSSFSDISTSKLFTKFQIPSDIIQDPIQCIWQPLYGSSAKKERKENLTTNNIDNNNNNTIIEISISCPQISCILSENTTIGNDIHPIINFILDDNIIIFNIYKNIEDNNVISIYSTIQTYSLLDNNSDIIISPSNNTQDNILNSTSIYATPLFSSLPPRKTDDSIQHSDTNTPLRASLTSLQDSLFSPSTNDTIRPLKSPIDRYRRNGSHIIFINGKYVSKSLALDINISQCNISYNPHIIENIMKIIPSSNASSNTISKKLHKGELLWQQLYLKIQRKLKQDFKEKSAREQIECIKFQNWNSFQSHKLFNKLYRKFTIMNTVTEDFFIPTINIVVSNINISLQESNNTNLDINIPSLSLSTIDNKSDYYINTSITSKLLIPQIQIYLIRLNNTINMDDSILTSNYSEDDNIDDINEFSNNEKIPLLDINSIVGTLFFDTNPIINTPSILIDNTTNSININITSQDINILIPIISSNIPSITNNTKQVNNTNKSNNFPIKFISDIRKIICNLKDDNGKLFCKTIINQFSSEYIQDKNENIIISLNSLYIKEFGINKQLENMIKENNNMKFDIIIRKNITNWIINMNINNYHVNILPNLIKQIQQFISNINQNKSKYTKDKVKNNEELYNIIIDINNSSILLFTGPSKQSIILKSKYINFEYPKLSIISKDIIGIFNHPKQNIGSIKQLNVHIIPNNNSIESFGTKLNISIENITRIKYLITYITSTFISNKKDTKEEDNKIHSSKFSWIFNDSSVYFYNITGKQVICLTFSQFQVLKVFSANSNYLALGFSKGECLIEKNKKWETILTNSSNESYSVSSYPDLISNVSSCISWNWEQKPTKLIFDINTLSGNIKDIIIVYNHINSIISSISSSNKDTNEKQLVKNKKKDINTTEYSIYIHNINLTYTPDNTYLYKNSCYRIYLNQIILKILNGKRLELFQLTLQDIIFNYIYIKNNNEVLVNLFKSFGISFGIIQTDSISDAQLQIDCTGILSTIPLILFTDFKYLGYDIIQFNKSLSKISKQSFNSFQENKEINILFSDSSYSKLKSHGYTWKGNNTLLKEKTIIWEYNTPHKIRKLYWINDSMMIRCSVVSLQYFDDNLNTFIDLYSPIEYNCSKSIVNIDIKTNILSKQWRLIFHKPLDLKDNNIYSWPWISSFKIYSDNIINNNNNNTNTIISKYTALHIKINIGQLNLRLSSSIRIQDTILLSFQNQLMYADILLAKHDNITPLQVNGFIQSSINISYQDLAILKMKYCFSGKPFIHFAYSNNGKLAFNIQQISDNTPLHINLSRSLLQLLRNIITYISNNLNNNNNNDIGMFYHFKFYNYCGYPILLSEIYNNKEFSNKDIIEPDETLYWKWSLISNQNRLLSKDINEQRIKLSIGNYESSLIDIKTIGEQYITLINKETSNKINILLCIKYPPHKEECTSTTIEIEIIGTYKITSNISIPIQILIPNIYNNSWDNNKSEQSYLSLQNNQSVYISIDTSKEYKLYFRVSSNEKWENISCKTDNGKYSSLVFLRKLSISNEQYAWINYSVSEIYGFKQILFIFSPIYYINNNISIPLRWKIYTQDICISEGLLDIDENITLYHSPKRKSYLQLCSGCVSIDSTEWSISYELSTINNKPYLIQLDSGIGKSHNLNTSNSILLDIYIYNEILLSNTFYYNLYIPYKITNLTDEGIFIAQVIQQTILKQIYIPPLQCLPFSCEETDKQSSISIFHYISGNNISTSLRNIAQLPNFYNLLGIDSKINIEGIYNAGYCIKKESYYLCNQYLIKLKNHNKNNIRELEFYSPFILKNLTEYNIIIDMVWPSKYRPDINIYNNNNKNENEIYISSGNQVSLHHWISTKAINYSGNEYISFLFRYDILGWLDEECNLKYINNNSNNNNNNNNNIYNLYNSISKEYSKVLITLSKPNNNGQYYITISPSYPFRFSFINYTHNIFYILIKETQEEIKIYPCTTMPLDIINKISQNGISISIRMTTRHRWSDYININRERNILLSLFGPKGSESIKINIKFNSGASYISICNFKSNFNTLNENPIIYKQNKILGYDLTLSNISEINSIQSYLSIEDLYNHHIQQYSSDIIINDSKQYLLQLFPIQSGIMFNIKFPCIIITISSENEKQLLDIYIQNINLNIKYYKPQSDNIKILYTMDDLTIKNLLSKQLHYPIRWGCNHNNNNRDNTLKAFSLQLYIPINYNNHIQKINISLGCIYLQLTGPFVSQLINEIPGWISAIKYPTQIRKTNNNIKNIKINNNNDIKPFFINEIQIDSWKIEITWVNFASHVIPIGIVPKNLLSLSNLRLNFSKILISGYPKDINIILTKILYQYKKDFIWQLFPSLGSIDILGNPTHMGRQIRHYIYSYISELQKLSFLSRNDNDNSLFKHTTSLFFGIIASIIDCTICFNSALKDLFYSFDTLNTITSTDLIDSASEQLKLFLQKARISLEEAMRNTVTKPIDGYYSNGIVGIISGTKKAISGWSKPCRAGLDVNIQILSFLRNWLLQSNSLPLMKSSHICNDLLSISSNKYIKNNINTNINNKLWNNDIILQWHNRKYINEEEYQCIFSIKKITSQYNTTLLHDRIILITNYSILLASGNILVFAIPLNYISKIINDKYNYSLCIYYKDNNIDCISNDAIITNYNNNLKYIQLNTISEKQHSIILFYLLCNNNSSICETILDKKHYNKLL